MVVESIDYKKCTSCDICMNVCPTDVFRKVGRLVYIAYPEDCINCYLCETECPVDCMYVSPTRGREITLPW
ncbi:MAG: 4Fe-4S binding protein [Nitrososphaerota archaeon]|nr:4Fe-4S binding protein [Nitrososphaerota archaeon]